MPLQHLKKHDTMRKVNRNASPEQNEEPRRTNQTHRSLKRFRVTAGSWSIILNCVDRDGARWLDTPWMILAHRESPEAQRLSTPVTLVGLVTVTVTVTVMVEAIVIAIGD